MTQFRITATTEAGEEKVFLYDNMTSSLTDEFGNAMFEADAALRVSHKAPPVVSISEPGRKSSDIRTLKIQLGLSCNYSCEYCSQRFVPHAENGNPHDVEAFMAGLPLWFDGGYDGMGGGVRVELWGGEPFVYWKTMKPLAEALKAEYPNIQLSTITNGSLLDREKVDWLERMEFAISISHDGPGQKTRGPDPFDDPVAEAGIRYALEKLKGRITINAMVHKDNPSRLAIQEWFRERGLLDDLRIGEGGFIDPYDEGGLAMSAPDAEWMRDFARNSYTELRNNDLSSFEISSAKIGEFIRSIHDARPASSLGQKCGMDDPQNITVDMKGNVLSCQNVSAAAVAMNGQPHKIGHVSDFGAIAMRTSTHWSRRKDCPSCPVLQLCKGGCMFLEGENWERGCDNAFIDNWVFFAAGFEVLTGYIPVRVEGGRPDREEPFDMKRTARKIIPIKAA